MMMETGFIALDLFTQIIFVVKNHWNWSKLSSQTVCARIGLAFKDMETLCITDQMLTDESMFLISISKNKDPWRNECFMFIIILCMYVNRIEWITGAGKIIKWALGYQLMHHPQNSANSKVVLSRERYEFPFNCNLP